MNPLPCPFCGEQPKVQYRELFKEWFVSCETCNLLFWWISPKKEKLGLCAKTSDEVVEKWNFRRTV